MLPPTVSVSYSFDISIYLHWYKNQTVNLFETKIHKSVMYVLHFPIENIFDFHELGW